MWEVPSSYFIYAPTHTAISTYLPYLSVQLYGPPVLTILPYIRLPQIFFFFFFFFGIWYTPRFEIFTFGSVVPPHLHLTTQATVASMPIFLGITSYWSQTDMRKINWFEKTNWFEKKKNRFEKNRTNIKNKLAFFSLPS